MSDIACHCGKRGALFARQDRTLVRWHHCREHLDKERIANEGLSDSKSPPSMPSIFLDTKVELLHPKIQGSLDWRPEGDISGLLYHGTTGVGKTRGIWEVVRRMWEEHAKRDKQLNYTFLTMRKLEGIIEAGFDTKTHNKAIDGLISCGLLVLDDLGKERLTNRMASDLFAIIDERSTARNPTIISTNFNGSAFLDRFDGKDKETGAAIIRRLRDYYKAVGIGLDNQ